MGTGKKSVTWLLWKQVVFPITIVLLVANIAYFFYNKAEFDRLEEHKRQRLCQKMLAFVELQYMALNLIEQPMNKQMHEYSSKIVNEIFVNTNNIERADLGKVMHRIGMDTAVYDLYVINRDGVIVNTTYPADMFVDFSTFGNSHVLYLNERFKKRNFASPCFFFESTTNRYRKYSYQPTLDGKYIIEIGVYSNLADSVYKRTIEFISNEVNFSKKLLEISQYALGEYPKSFDISKRFPQQHLPYLSELIAKGEVLIDDPNDDPNFMHNYLYVDCLKSDIYKGIIVGIKIDKRERNRVFLQRTIIQIISFLALVAVVVLCALLASKRFERPIVEFAKETSRVSMGHSKEPIAEHTDVKAFSIMIRSFNRLLDKIRERDLQIEKIATKNTITKAKVIELQELLNLQKKLSEEKNRGIEDEKSYAYYIQQSMIPQFSDFKKLFNDTFMLFKPRNVVSGDFFWYANHGSKVVIVVADSTGHGVQASFVSIIGITILNNIVNAQNITEPALVLSRMNDEIVELFGNNDIKNPRYDGYDMSVCCIDREQRSISFAGAQQRVVVVADGLLQTYKGSPYSIGTNDNDVTKVFTDSTITYSETASVYMFTNGYTAQFNSSLTRKMNYEPLREMLDTIHTKTMAEQLTLLDEFFNNWRKDSELTDDVLVLGVRIA